MLAFHQYKGMFRYAFKKGFRIEDFDPDHTYSAISEAFRKTEAQIKAHAGANEVITIFNENLAASIKKSLEEDTLESYQALIQKADEMVNALIGAVHWEIYGKGGRGWPSPERAYQILRWRKISTQNKRRAGRARPKVLKNKITNVGRRPEENTTVNINSRTTRESNPDNKLQGR